MPTLSYFGLIIELLNNTGPDKRWENMKGLVEKEGIGKVSSLFNLTL